MKIIYLYFKFLLIVFLLLPFSVIGQRYWVSAAPAAWTSNSWSSTSGGAPDGAGPPTVGVNAIFDGNGLGNCDLDANATFDGITINGYTGIIDLAGFSFDPTVSGTADCTFATGSIEDATNTSLVSFNTSGNLLFSGTTFHTPINGSAGRIAFNGGIYNEPVEMISTGSSNVNGTGGCTFNSTLKITNAGSSYFLMGYSNPDIFNDDVTFINSGTNRIRIAYNNAGHQFNGNINVGSINGGGVWIGEGNGTSTIAAGKTIIKDPTGFTTGDLRLKGFTQDDATPINITLTGTANIYFQTNSNFLGAITVTSPGVFFSGSTFNGIVNATKNGTASSAGAGGNTFNAHATFTNTSSNYLSFGNGTPDIFNADITVINSGSERIFFGHNSAGNEFNGNITVEQNGSGTGILLAYGGGSSSTIAAGKTIIIGAGGFTTGTLSLAKVTQLGADAINLTTTGNSSIITGPNSTYLGPLTLTSPNLLIQGGTYNGPVSFTKTGGTSNHNSGNQNIFNSTVEINQQSTEYFMLGYNSNDLFNDDITLNSTNTGIIYFGYVNGTGTPTLAAGKTILIGPDGYNQGTLYLGGFTQLGNAAIALSMNGANFTVSNLPNACVFGGPVSVTADNIRIQGATFNSATSFTKTGGVDNHNGGNQNIFNSTLEINQQSTGYFMLGYNSNDLFQDDITINSTNTGLIRLGHSSGTGSPTLAAGKTIHVGGTGMNDGGLYLGFFTQLGNAPLNLNFSNLASLYFFTSTIGGDLTSSSDNINFAFSNFAGTINSISTGTSSSNSVGGNTFSGDVNLTNSSSAIYYMGNGNPDDFQGNLTIINNGTSSFNLAHNSVGNQIAGNLDITNSGNGTGTTYFTLLDNAISTLTVGGNIIGLNNGNSTNCNMSLCNQGSLTANGNVTLTNAGSGNTSVLHLANYSSSSAVIAGVANVTNNSTAATTSRVYLGNQGDVIFNNDLTLINNSNSTNSEVYLNNGINSTNQYNGNILISSTHVDSDGFLFGASDGSGTLAINKSISIPGVDTDNFVGGNLNFINFTQLGPTNHSFELASTAYRIYNRNSSWGGDISFIAPRIYNNTTVFNGTSYFEKTGSGNDDSFGGCTHTGDAEYILNNTIAAGRMYLANSLPNTYGGNLTLRNTGTFDNLIYGSSIGIHDIVGDVLIENTSTGTGSQHIYFINNIDGIANIGGNVTINNSAMAASGSHYAYLSNNGEVNITGNLSATNSSSGSNSILYIGNSGSITIGGNLDMINSSTATATAQLTMANNASSSILVNGNTTLNSSTVGTSGQCYLGNNGDVTFLGTLDMTNASQGNNNHIFLNDKSTSSNTYNNDIFIKSTNLLSDGIWFGNNGGQGILAATKTITIPGVDPTNFIGGDLYFRNFTQVGPTNHSFELASTADYIYNYDSNWGGDINFIAPRIYNRTTVFNGSSYFEKTGSGNDDSYGGCTHSGDAEYILNNTIAAGRMFLANTLPNSYGGNLTLRNTGTFDNLLYGNSAGTTNITGDLLLENISTGTGSQYIYLMNNVGAIANIGGSATIINNANTTSGAHRIYVSNRGQVNITGNSTALNSSTGTDSYIYLGVSGSVDFGGNLDITNSSLATTNAQIRMAESTSSNVVITGNTTVNSSTVATNGYCYLGYSGNVTFNGTLDLTNNSSGTNNHIYLNDRTTSVNMYNDDILVKSTNLSSDGIWFGNGDGQGTLAATKTITIPGVDPTNFIGGRLHFRNFTQTGNTPHSFELASTASYIYNYSSNWGGDVNFVAPRIYNRSSIFNGISYFEKIGSGDDNSYGDNTYVGNVEFVSSNSVSNGRFYLANSLPSQCNANLTLRNKGAYGTLQFGGAAGNYSIDGDVLLENITTGTTNTHVYLLNHASAIADIAGNIILTNTSPATAGTQNISICQNGNMTIAGTTTATNNATIGNSKNIILGNTGNITFNDDVTIRNIGTTATSQIIMASGTSSSITVNGNVDVLNSATGNSGYVYLGNNGDITFNGLLDIHNQSTANNSTVLLSYNINSLNHYNNHITVESSVPGCDGVFFGGNNGTGILADTKTLTIGGAGFSSGELKLRNFTQIGNTAQNITLTNVGTILNNYDSEWNGNVDFRAPRHYTRGTTYNGDAYLEKTNASDDASTGGNTYNGSTQIVNSGSGYFMPANGTSDDFNGDVSFIQNGVGRIHPNYNCTSTYAGNINIDYANNQIYFGSGGNGRTLLDGTGNQSINDLGSSMLPLFRDFQVNKASGDVILNMPIEITTDLDLDQGIVYSSSTSLISVRDNAIVSSVSDASHIDGPIRKIGNDAFEFPVGKSGYYRPISISNPSNASHHFTAEFFATDPDGVEGAGPVIIENPIENISDCEYWILDRTNGASNVNVTLSFRDYNNGCSGVGDLSSLSIARWDNTSRTWTNNPSTAVGIPNGTITTNSAITTFSPFALATSNDGNDLPIELINFEANTTQENDVLLTWQTASEINNDFFTIEKSANGIDFEFVAEVKGAGNSASILNYSTTDFSPFAGESFYRLKQTDFDGAYEYSEVIKVQIDNDNEITIYPNPVNKNDKIINILSDEHIIDELKIIDNLGRVIYNQTINSNQIGIDVSTYDSGVYFVQITQGSVMITKRIVI